MLPLATLPQLTHRSSGKTERYFFPETPNRSQFRGFLQCCTCALNHRESIALGRGMRDEKKIEKPQRMGDKKKAICKVPSGVSRASLALQEATSTPWRALQPEAFLASTHRAGCLAGWITAHSSLHCHICHLQTEGSVFWPGTGRTGDLWHGEMECSGGENSIANSLRSRDHPSSSSGCQ